MKKMNENEAEKKSQMRRCGPDMKRLGELRVGPSLGIREKEPDEKMWTMMCGQ